MSFQATGIQDWFYYALFFVAVSIVLGTIAIAAVKQLKKIAANDGEKPRWQFADVQTILAFIVVAAMIAVIFSLLYKPPAVDSALKEVLLVMIGQLSMKFSDVYAYFFNSTLQSKAKDDTARVNADTAASAVATASKSADTIAKNADAIAAAILPNVVNGNGGGGDHATTIKVTPPPAPDSVSVNTTISDTSKPKDEGK